MQMNLILYLGLTSRNDGKHTPSVDFNAISPRPLWACCLLCCILEYLSLQLKKPRFELSERFLSLLLLGQVLETLNISLQLLFWVE